MDLVCAPDALSGKVLFCGAHDGSGFTDSCAGWCGGQQTKRYEYDDFFSGSVPQQ